MKHVFDRIARMVRGSPDATAPASPVAGDRAREESIRTAIAAHQAGRFDEAERIYRDLLCREPRPSRRRPDALEGARATITAARPGLAISVCHQPAQLGQIPRLIPSCNLGYGLEIQGNGHGSFDTALYAFPSAPRIPARRADCVVANVDSCSPSQSQDS
jgi:hypothetical protein